VDCDEDYNQALYDALNDSDNYCEGKSCGGSGGSDKSGDSGSGSGSEDK
jgi:hypothetical protein